MAWEDEYNDLPGLDKKFRRQEQEPLLGSEQPTEQQEEETDPLAGLDLLGGFMQDDYLQGLQTQASEAKQRQTQSMTTMQGIMDEVTADIERRRQEMKPRFTQQELDDRRAKSTAVTMLTSALANIANGIAVGKGGLNATVPDGYQAAYEHWNDVQKRHSARQAEYDKLTDAINANRLAKVKLEYGEGSAEYKEAAAKIENELNRRNRFAQTQAEIQGRKEIAQMNNESRERTAAITAQGGVEKAKVEGRYKVSVEKEKTNREKVKAENRGVDLEGYRTMESTNPDVGKITIPDGTDVEQGYLKLAKHAIPILKKKWENATKEDKTKLSKLISDIQSNTFSGNDKNKEVKIKNLQKLLPNSGLTKEELDAAFNTQTQEGGGQPIGNVR